MKKTGAYITAKRIEKDISEEELAKNKKLFIHHDIRPFDDLGSIKELDREFSKYIPWIIKMTERF